MKLSWSRVLRHAALLMTSLTRLVPLQARAAATAAPAEIRVDYAYYSPESLVIKHFG